MSHFLLLLCAFFGDPIASVHPSDGPDADFRVHIEAERVRFFITLNLAFADEIVQVAREVDDDLHEVEEPWLHEALVKYFTENNRVLIDGELVKPVDAGFEVLDADDSFLPLFPKMGRRALIQLELKLDYPVAAMPKNVEVQWAAFPPDYAIGDEFHMPTVMVKGYFNARGILVTHEFREEEPGYTWHNTGTSASDLMMAVPEPPQIERWPLPLASLFLSSLAAVFWFVGLRKRSIRWVVPVCLIAAVFSRNQFVLEVPAPGGGITLPTVQQAEQIFEPLHANVYRAFDYTAPSDVYDALEESVDGALLESLYAQVYRGLIQQEQGGAVSRVQAVRPLQLRIDSIGVLPDDGRVGFDAEVRWQVDGRVSHWGHAHDRTNEYLARYTVVQTPDGWRIGGSQILESTTVSAVPEGAGG